MSVEWSTDGEGGPPAQADEDGVSLDCHLWNDADTASSDGFTHEENFPQNNQARIDFVGSAANPLEPPAPITWNMRTVINATNPNAAFAYVNYNHTCYPAHHIKVNGTIVYEYVPSSSDPVTIFNCLALGNGKIIGEQNTVTAVPNHP